MSTEAVKKMVEERSGEGESAQRRLPPLRTQERGGACEEEMSAGL